MQTFDAIVVGTGGVGSAALHHLAQRGAKVLGVDQYPPPHNHGSSHGQSRIIRQAYFEHPNYTPLLLESYRLWSELESATESVLYHETGVLQIGPPQGVVVPGVLNSAVKHGLRLEVFTAEQIEQRWPGFHVPGELMGVLEPRAGYLLVEDCVRAHLQAAQAYGAELRTPVEAVNWQPGETILLQTSEGTIQTKRLIVTAGPWAEKLLGQLGVEFRVLRKSLFWFERAGTPLAQESNYPCYLFELPQGVFYGFPEIDQRGLKVAEHSGGQPVADPQNVDREILPEDQRRVENFLMQHLPGVAGKLNEHSTCLYTMSPDEHFIVDRLPSEPNVVFAAGLSGHGFKFTLVLGKALADLALDGKTNLPIDFLSLERF